MEAFGRLMCTSHRLPVTDLWLDSCLSNKIHVYHFALMAALQCAGFLFVLFCFVLLFFVFLLLGLGTRQDLMMVMIQFSINLLTYVDQLLLSIPSDVHYKNNILVFLFI